MLNNIKHNGIVSSGKIITPKTSDSHSEVNFLQRLESKEVKLNIITTTDVLTDLMSNVISVLLNIELMKDNNGKPVFILRDALFDKTDLEGREQLVAMWRINQENAIKAGLSAYQFAINNGMNENKAAAVLPVGNTMVSAEVIVLDNIVEYSADGLTSECAEILNLCQQAIKNHAKQ